MKLSDKSTVALLSFLSFVFIFSACASNVKIQVALEPPKAIEPSDKFQAGVAKVDITPPPGYPMAGYSLFGRFSRGWWTRLYAKAIYLEDHDGNRIVLVSCDLQSIPAGLADKTAEIVQQLSESDSTFLGREQIILAATHTHLSPGNIFSSKLLNSQASMMAGFDQPLFDFTAYRIAHAIMMAIKSKKPATLKMATVDLPGLTRNRSLAAFQKNPEHEKQAILDQVSNPEKFFTPDLPAVVTSATAFQAVDPTLTVLSIDAKDTEAPIGVAAFYAVHNTAMGSETEVYSSDIFGVASTLVEQHLRSKAQGENAVVAIFNGPEADISPNWKKQDRHNTLEIGRGLAEGIIAGMNKDSETIHGDISYRYEVVKIADRQVQDLHNDAENLCVQEQSMWTAKKGYVGVATIGGAEDGRTPLYNFGLREGVTSQSCDSRQGFKLFGGDKILEIVLPDTKGWIPNLISAVIKEYVAKGQPDEIPLGVYSIGSVVLGTLPGEFTVALGRRITETLRKATGVERVLLVGLANEYLSYFTTPSEYNAQHYEGASTMYGQVAGLFVEQELARIAKLGKNTANYDREKTYIAGEKTPSGFGKIKMNDSWQMGEALSNLIQDSTGFAFRHFPQFIWWDKPVVLSNARAKVINPSAAVNSFVSIEEQKLQVCKPLAQQTKSLVSGVKLSYPESDAISLNFVTVIDSVSLDSQRSHAVWMVPSGMNLSQTVRFCVTTPDGRTIHSEPFQISDVLVGKKDPVIPIDEEKKTTKNR